MGVFGIDVSHYQSFTPQNVYSPIDWKRVATSERKFAIIKATEGISWFDDEFRRNWDGAKQAGIVVGAYHYFRPGIGDVSKQAAHFFNKAHEPEPDDMVPWLDVEDEYRNVTDWRLKRNPVPFAQVAEEVLAMLELLDDMFECRVGIYTGEWFWRNLGIPVPERPLWLATYWSDGSYGKPRLPLGTNTWHIHQYSSTGSVPGIARGVDLNWMPGELSALQVGGKPIADPLPDIGPHLQLIRSSVDAIERALK